MPQPNKPQTFAQALARAWARALHSRKPNVWPRQRLNKSFVVGGFRPRVCNPLCPPRHSHHSIANLLAASDGGESQERYGAAIEYVEAPAKVNILLLQHIGPVARPVVDIGQHVQAMQLIAQNSEGKESKEQRAHSHAPQGFLYSCIHSPIEGIVTAIENHTLANGLKTESIVIEHEVLPAELKRTQDQALGRPEQIRQAWRGRGYKEILERIAQAGVVGMGGATFPTNAKLRLPINRRCDYLLLNATECEPYLHSDASLLNERAFDVIGGIDVLADGLKPKYIVMGLEQDKAYLLPKLQAAIRSYRLYLQDNPKDVRSSRELLPPIRIATLKTQYPQGAERQLIQAICGREVPIGKLPMEIGCIVVNVATCKAIYDAVEHGLPLTRRIVTVSGGAVRQPKVFDAPLGCPLSELLQRCGGLQHPVARMMNGGPLMGTSFYDWRQFVTKGSSGFLFLTAKEVLRKKERPCIHCNECIQVCPMGLDPIAMYQHIMSEDLAGAVARGLASCIECGACASVCPSQISLTQGFQMGKVYWRQLQAAEDTAPHIP